MNLLDIYNFIIEHFPANIVPNLIIAVTVVGLGVWSVNKKEKIRHPRCLSRFITLMILIFLVSNEIILDFSRIPIICALVMLVMIYALTAYLAAKKPILHSKKKLEDLRNLLLIGYSLNDEKLFDKKPFYLIDYAENYQYQILKAEHLRSLERFDEAYEVYQSLDDQKLFEDEKRALLRKKVHMLYLLGDMNRAIHYLSYIEDEAEPNYLMLKAMIEENSMELEAASEHWQKALNVTSETKEPLLKAEIYNNYGRLRIMEGNLTDAISFYRKSYEIAKTQKKREIIHCSFQNFILTSLIKGDKQKVPQYFKEYELLILDKTLCDMKEEFNLRVEIARQNENSNEISKAIVDGYKGIRPLLPNKNQIIFDVSTLRMMFNNKMNFELVMDRIYDNIEEYFDLKMPEKYNALKEINIPLREIQFPYYHKYALVHKRINEYMIKDAFKEIDDYIIGLKDYEVRKRCTMELEKVSIQKEWTRPYNFGSIYSSMRDIKEIYQKNGMLIEAIFMDLNIADECFAPDNRFDNKIKTIPKQKMTEHVELAADNLRKLKQYPSVVEGNIRLACYYMVLQENEKAQKHFEYFEEAKIPIHHFAIWIQRYYVELSKEFKISLA